MRWLAQFMSFLPMMAVSKKTNGIISLQTHLYKIEDWCSENKFFYLLRKVFHQFGEQKCFFFENISFLKLVPGKILIIT